MNSNNLRNKIGGFILAFAVVPGIAIVGSATAQAQNQAGQEQEQRNGARQRDGVRNPGRDRRDDQNRDRNRDDRNRGRNRDDRHRHQDDRYRQNQRRGSYGNGDYGNYGNRGGNGNRYQYAESQGFQDGLSTGASDASRGQSYNPQRSHFYRNANNGGDQQAYRSGFLRGYQEGYQRNGGGRGGNNRGRNNGGRFPW
jgi:hypothetical protein